jgi:2-keto-4-pentenoate hydratase
MSEKPMEPFEVICPCCQAKLRIDPEMRAVLSHELPPEERTVKDLTDAVKELKAEAEQRQARFEESLKQQKQQKDLLDRKFQDALKRTKNAPITRPVRDIDLD